MVVHGHITSKERLFESDVILKMMRDNYRKYNKLRKTVNESVGILPFLWMFELFVEISGGITEASQQLLPSLLSCDRISRRL